VSNHSFMAAHERSACPTPAANAKTLSDGSLIGKLASRTEGLLTSFGPMQQCALDYIAGEFIDVGVGHLWINLLKGGAKLYARECGSCHGSNREARRSAPPLSDHMCVARLRGVCSGSSLTVLSVGECHHPAICPKLNGGRSSHSSSVHARRRHNRKSHRRSRRW
jgi:hypothetical protein